MSLITQAYFQEGDFSNTDIIRQTYQNLNDCLTDDMLHTQQLYVGLSGNGLTTPQLLSNFLIVVTFPVSLLLRTMFVFFL
jgi:hypothetical protein